MHSRINQIIEKEEEGRKMKERKGGDGGGRKGRKAGEKISTLMPKSLHLLHSQSPVLTPRGAT